MKNPFLRIFCFCSIAAVVIFAASCKKSSSTATTDTVPSITTPSIIINLTATSAQSGGIITSNGEATITANGVCYSSTDKTPTISDSKTTDTISTAGTATTTFTSTLTNLTPNTLYYLRAYATNSVGTAYGSVITFTTSANLASVNSAVTTFAGSGAAGYADGSGTSALFNNPQGVAVDSKGNIFVADTYNNMIREITPGGVVTTVAGSQAIGYVDGPVATAQFYAPRGLTVDPQGNIYVADYGNNVIRKISNGVVSTFSGNGIAGYVDGSNPIEIEYRGPTGVVLDAAGNVYVSDRGNNLIRKITPANVSSTLAGTNSSTYVAAYVNGTDLVAAFNEPNAVTIDGSGNVYTADQANGAIRKITTPAGVTTTVAGGPGQLSLINLPSGVSIDATGNIYISDESGRILEYSTNNALYILAGKLNVSGFVNGSGATAQFSNPQGIAVDASGNIYVADQGNNCIRKITVTLVN